jgi:hypothetical protein
METAGYALLVPWAVAQTTDGLGAWQATAALFMLPVFAMMLGLGGLHALLWRRRSVAMFGALVVLASVCLVGSVVGSAVGRTESARVVLHER